MRSRIEGWPTSRVIIGVALSLCKSQHRSMKQDLSRTERPRSGIKRSPPGSGNPPLLVLRAT
jgi:hypothetical protein